MDFLLTVKRDAAPAMRYFDKALLNNGAPEKATISNKTSIRQAKNKF